VIRAPAVAGSFYPASPDALERTVDSLLGEARGDLRVRAVVAPHAGYVYSGRISGEVYAKVRVPDLCVVLCPNHTGAGARRSLDADETWRTPLGDVSVDAALAGALLGRAGIVRDVRAHAREHALEVHLPFLQRKNPRVRIVPLCLGGIGVDACLEIGAALADAVSRAGEDVLVVASTDMSHYISADEAARLDRMALDRVEALDAPGLFRAVAEHDITMCGFIPTTVTLAAAKALGAERATLVRYGNSGETSGDYDQVVGYAGLVIP
jgi:MEMO1 family protein